MPSGIPADCACALITIPNATRETTQTDRRFNRNRLNPKLAARWDAAAALTALYRCPCVNAATSRAAQYPLNLRASPGKTANAGSIKLQTQEHSMDAHEFRTLGHQVVDLLADYFAHIEEKPVFPDVEPRFLTQLF